MEPVTLVVTGRSLHQSALLYRPKGRVRNGRWGPVPRSAPPQLSRRRPTLTPSSAASRRNMRVASAHSAKATQQPPQLSVDDVYMLAERTRMRTSLESRHLVLVQTQKMVRNDSGMSRPLTALTSRGNSQGQGCETYRMTERRQSRKDVREEDALGFVSNVEISVKPRTASSNDSGNYSGKHRLSSAVTNASSFTGSELACMSPRPHDPEARKMSVARQCCEVMGPGVCRDCRKLRVRMMDRERMEADFPRLRVSEKNVTTSAIVKRVLPDMTQAEIQDKIARGEIARSSLLFPRRRCHNGDDDSDDSDDNDSEHQLRHNGLHAPQGEPDYDSDGSDDRASRAAHSDNRHPDSPRGSDAMSRQQSGKSNNSLLLLTKLKLNLRREASTPLFFMDLRHMNAKIFQGLVGKSLRPPKAEEAKKESLLSAPNPLYPTFVSPRKSKLIEEPAYKVYFDPPLLAKHQQVSNPSFFAGSDDPYSLPERLPDVLEFADGKLSITDPSSALRSESSMSFVSAISEEGLELSQRGEVFRPNRALQETVQE